MSLVGTTVGRIRVTEALGEGGMGAVYAGWDEALERRVALKAIRDEERLDTDTKARFLREARILSQLDHPCICRIHGLVETDDGDFLVLELIEGRSLRAALREDLPPALRLHVAEMVTQALAAAHAQGVVHRDLKPENVMLTPEGAVKVLDFGLAHKVDPQRDVSTAADIEARADIHSDTAGAGDERPISKTVAMADAPWREPTHRPADGEYRTERGVVMGTVGYMSPEQARGETATAAGDLYSLGLLLQELFTGRPAYPPDLAFMAVFARAAAGDTLPVTGIDRDLAELITRLKALAPEARPTAAETAERLRDVRTKPVRRLLWRLAALLVLALVCGGLKYTWDLRREKRLAVEARREAEQVSDFLVGLFAVSDPRTARGDTITARELLDAGAARIASELRDQPLSRARLMLTMGRVYRQLGLYAEARPLLEEALATRRRLLGPVEATAACLDELASLEHGAGEYERAEPRLREALEIREAVFGKDDPRVAASLNNLAVLDQALGEDERAESLYRRALAINEAALGTEHPDLAPSLASLGELYRARGDDVRAEAVLSRAVRLQEAALGTDHPALAPSLNNLAMVAAELGEDERAETLYRRTLAISEKVLGSDHPDVATTLNNLAELYRREGRYAEAEPLYRRAVAIQEAALGDAHPLLAITLANLADLVTRLGRYDEAEALYLRSLAIGRQIAVDQPGRPLGPGRQAAALVGLGKLYRAAGAEQRAAAAWTSAADLLSPFVAGTGPADSAGLLHTRALALLYLDRPDEARPLAEELLARGWNQPEFLDLCRRRAWIPD